jgi:putative copper resistance protein D
MAAGWARWLELRLEPPTSRIAGWIWPTSFLLVGLTLVAYRES